MHHHRSRRRPGYRCRGDGRCVGVAAGVDVGMTVAAGVGVEAAAADDAGADVDGFDPTLDATPPQAVSVRNTPAKAS